MKLDFTDNGVWFKHNDGTAIQFVANAQWKQIDFGIRKEILTASIIEEIWSEKDE